MIVTLDKHKKVNYRNSNNWSRDKSTDPMIVHMESLGWKQESRVQSDFIPVWLNGPRCHRRFLAQIRRLKRSVHGCSYRMTIEYTPYLNDDIRFNGYFNTKEELETIINEIHPGLIIKLAS